MLLYRKIKIDPKIALLSPIMEYMERHNHVALLNSNSKTLSSESDFEYLIGFGVVDELIITSSKGDSFSQLRSFHQKNKDWIFGHLSYDLKNELEDLQSNNIDRIQFPLLTFFAPLVMVKIKQNLFSIYISEHEKELGRYEADDFMDAMEKELENSTSMDYNYSIPIFIQQRMNRTDYNKNFKNILNHIQQGDIYEMNFCQEFYSEEIELNPYLLYNKLNKISPSPFSVFYRINDKFLVSSSPERFLKKVGSLIISQPIKGTSSRFFDKEKDENSRTKLKNNQKERAENVMIVDLVRNDLSKTAKQNSVKVEELCGIYSFPQVHQMISTITSELREDYDFVDLLKTTFPMGSMTGAPKIRAMQLIEEFETTRRGLYSGAVGYITPEGDFDFNVVIRSILYNQTTKYVNFITGGAITSKSTAEQEYVECMLKAKGIMEALG